jgi:hypothetical protein
MRGVDARLTTADILPNQSLQRLELDMQPIPGVAAAKPSEVPFAEKIIADHATRCL